MVALAALPAACGKDRSDRGSTSTAAESKDDPGDKRVVARVGKRTITVGEVNEHLNNQNPYVRLRFASPERKREFVENMVRFEVLAAEAKRKGLDRDPEVIRRTKRVMIDRLIDQLRSDLVKLEQISDADIKAYYQEHIDQYKQPPKVRGCLIVVKDKARAAELRARALKKPTDRRYFASMAQEHSIHQPTSKRGCDTKPVPKDGSDDVPAAVARALFETKGLWQVTAPFKVDQGWAIAMKTGEQEAVDIPLEVERNKIRNRLFNQRRLKAVEDYVEKLQAKAKVKIIEKNLEKIEVDLRPSKHRK